MRDVRGPSSVRSRERRSRPWGPRDGERAGDIPPFRGHGPPCIVAAVVVDHLVERDAFAGDLDDECVPDTRGGVRRDLVIERGGVRNLGLPPEDEIPDVLPGRGPVFLHGATFDSGPRLR